MQFTGLWYFTTYPGILLISILQPIQNKDGELRFSVPTFLLINQLSSIICGGVLVSKVPSLRCIACWKFTDRAKRHHREHELKDYRDWNAITYPLVTLAVDEERNEKGSFSQ